MTNQEKMKIKQSKKQREPEELQVIANSYFNEFLDDLEGLETSD